MTSNSHTALPKALHQGKLQLGDAEFDCYVLDDGRRVLSTRTVTKALTGKIHGGLSEYLGAAGLRGFLASGRKLGDSEKKASNSKALTLAEFHIKDSHNGWTIDSLTSAEVVLSRPFRREA